MPAEGGHGAGLCQEESFHAGEKPLFLTCFLSWKFCFPHASLHIFRNFNAKELYDLKVSFLALIFE